MSKNNCPYCGASGSGIYPHHVKGFVCGSYFVAKPEKKENIDRHVDCYEAEIAAKKKQIKGLEDELTIKTYKEIKMEEKQKDTTYQDGVMRKQIKNMEEQVHVQKGRLYLINKSIVQMKKTDNVTLELIPLFKKGMQFIYTKPKPELVGKHITEESMGCKRNKVDQHKDRIYTLIDIYNKRNWFWCCRAEPVCRVSGDSIELTEQELYELMENEDISFIYNHKEKLMHKHPYTINDKNTDLTVPYNVHDE